MPAGAAGFEKPPYLDWTSKTGNGSLYSTARDLLAFQRALQRGTLLKPDTVAASYGFGPCAHQDRRGCWERMVGYGGAIDGEDSLQGW